MERGACACSWSVERGAWSVRVLVERGSVRVLVERGACACSWSVRVARGAGAWSVERGAWSVERLVERGAALRFTSTIHDSRARARARSTRTIHEHAHDSRFTIHEHDSRFKRKPPCAGEGTGGFGSGSPVDSPPESRATNPVWVSSRIPTTSRGCSTGARERFHSQHRSDGVSSLTPRAQWVVGLHHPCRRCSSSDRDTGAAPVQRRTGSRGPERRGRPEGRLRRPGLLSWGSSITSPPARPSLRRLPPGPSPRLRFGTATSRTCSVPAVPPGFNGLLRSEQIRRSARSTACRFVAPCSRSWGSPSFGLPWHSLAAVPSTRRSWTRRSGEVLPCGEYPSKRSPPRQPSTMPSPRLVLSDGSRSPAGVPSRRSSRARFRVATVRCSTRRPQGVFPPRSPLRSRDVAAARPLDAPLGFWIDSFPMLPRESRRPVVLDVSPGGPDRFGVPRPERRGKAGCFGPVWLLATDGAVRPEGRTQSIAVAPASPEGGTSAASVVSRRTDGCQWIRPERRSTASVHTPEGVRLPTSSRRISEETRSRPSARSEERRPVVRARALRPSAVARVHEERPLAADVHARRRVHLRATRAHPALFEEGGCCVEPADRIPKDSIEGRAGGTTRRWALGGS